MAANLTPQYRKAEDEYRRAATTEEQLRCLEQMFREIPKHKSSEKLQAELKHKISRAKKDLEAERRSPTRGPGVRIPRQGAGTAILLGGPNAGKSQLLARLTRATPEVAPYPFTTHAPLPGMMPFEDVMVQLVDTPPITADHLEPYLQGLIRGADVALFLVDVSRDEGLEEAVAALDKLRGTKTGLARTSYLDENDIGRSYTRTILVPNKIDEPGSRERLALFREMTPVDWPEQSISALHGEGLEALREAIFHALDVIRVYTRPPGARAHGAREHGSPAHSARDSENERPFTLRRGGTVADVAELIHRDIATRFKFARVWGSRVHDGAQVKGDHVLSDKDIVEVHV